MNIQAAIEVGAPKLPLPRSEVKKTVATAREILDHLDLHGTEKVLFTRNRLASRDYILCKIDMAAAAIVEQRDLIDINAAHYRYAPIVVDVNKSKVGASPSGGYTPKIIVVEGTMRHAQAAHRGDTHILAWVGAEAIGQIFADDKMGSNELRDKCQECLREKFKNDPTPCTSCAPSSSAWINEVYPFENYFIYNYDGNSYRQNYKVNQKKRSVTFDGEPKQVYQTYSDVAAGNGRKKNVNTQLHFQMEAAMGTSLGEGTQSPASAPLGSTSPNAVRPMMRGCKACSGMQAMGHSCDDGMKAASKDYAKAVHNGYRSPKKMLAVAPPGHEDQVLKLKEKYGENSSVPFKIAWHQHGKNKDNMDAMSKRDITNMPKHGDSSLQSPGSGNGPRMKSQVHAGGPGSGRHPGGGWTKDKRNAVHPRWAIDTYKHKDHPGHQLDVPRKDGSQWNHWNFNTSGGKPTGSGKVGDGSLQKYVANKFGSKDNMDAMMPNAVSTGPTANMNMRPNAISPNATMGVRPSARLNATKLKLKKIVTKRRHNG